MNIDSTVFTLPMEFPEDFDWGGLIADQQTAPNSRHTKKALIKRASRPSGVEVDVCSGRWTRYSSILNGLWMDIYYLPKAKDPEMHKDIIKRRYEDFMAAYVLGDL